MEGQGGIAAGLKATGECAPRGARKQALRGPECDGGGSGTRTFERDLAEVQVFGSEVRKRRVVFVVAPDAGIAEEDAAAAVGLEAVLVGVDDEGVGVGDGVEGGACGGREIAGEGEVASVSRVDVDAEGVFLLE